MNWSAELARPLTLKTGDRLVTLGDAGDALARYFATTIEDRAVALAIELLLKAAQSGKLADRKAATAQVVIVLRWRVVY